MNIFDFERKVIHTVPVAAWDGSKYDPDKLGNQAVKGTFPAPLPVYVTNPNNRTPSAVINVVDPTARMLSARQLTQGAASAGPQRAPGKAMPESIELDGLLEKKYAVELLHPDGSVTTEVISIFVEISD